MSHSVRVMIVEDHEDAGLMLQRILKHKGFEPLWVKDGLEAYEKAPAFQPKIVISDIGLPVMDRFELATRLRALPRLSFGGLNSATDRQVGPAWG